VWLGFGFGRESIRGMGEKKGDYSVGASSTLHLGDAGRYLVSPHKRSTLSMVTYPALVPCLYTAAVLRSCSARGNFVLGEGSMMNYPTDNHDGILTDVGCRRGGSRRRSRIQKHNTNLSSLQVSEYTPVIRVKDPSFAPAKVK